MKGLDPIYKVSQLHKFDKGRRCWVIVINWFLTKMEKPTFNLNISETNQRILMQF